LQTLASVSHVMVNLIVTHLSKYIAKTIYIQIFYLILKLYKTCFINCILRVV